MPRSRVLETNAEIVDMMATAIASYGFLNGAHSILAIIAVDILGTELLGAWGHAALYPPLFGNILDCGVFNLKGVCNLSEASENVCACC